MLRLLLIVALSNVAWAADHTRVTYYADDAGVEHPVKTPADWAKRRAAILKGMQEAMGPLPERANLPPLDVKVLAEEKTDAFTKLTISFVAERRDPEERIPALLYLPAKSTGKNPAILALHQTAKLGKGDPKIAAADHSAGYAVELARRGYVVLCPDYPSFGDYPYDFDSPAHTQRYASGTMKGIFNHMRAVDLLVARPDVDAGSIGAIGHSLGGHNALFVAAFDERIKAVVTSCGWTPFADYYNGNIKGWTSDRYMPRLRDVYKLDPKQVPFDFYEVVAALAPRHVYSSSPLKDHNFDVNGVKKADAEARKIFTLLGAPDHLRIDYPDAAHEFPEASRNASYDFLDAALKRRR
jgi:dienelactone hydrolase